MTEHYCAGCVAEELGKQDAATGIVDGRPFDGKQALKVKHTCGKQVLHQYRVDRHQWEKGKCYTDEEVGAILSKRTGVAVGTRIDTREDKCSFCGCMRMVQRSLGALGADGSVSISETVLLYERRGIPHMPDKMPDCN